MKARREAYEAVRGRLEAMDDSTLLRRLGSVEATEGLGGARVLDIGGSRVFTKSLPLTREESEKPYGTENLFRLPAYYHYGVGSAGFGAFRELAAHVKTTRWVLGGDIDTFPLMYHHRVLPLRGETFHMGEHELDEYVAYWDGCEQIRDYMLARRRAESHVVLFLEYVPHVLRSWLSVNLGQVDMVIAGMMRTIEFLRERGVGHFDAHTGNILTDGRQVFLTDFGLVLDEEFALDADERAFFAAHRHFDAGEFIRSLYWPVRQLSDAWDDATKEAVCARYGDAAPFTLLDNLDALAGDGRLELPVGYRDTLRKYRGVIDVMDRVFAALRGGSKSEGGYDDEELRRALGQAGATC